MNEMAGYLIRYHRNRQNISQEGLCKGICVVSYLSKIEQGVVIPSKDIIEQLFQRLSLTYMEDPDVLEVAGNLLEDLFEKMDMHLNPKEEYAKLKGMEKELECYPLCVDFLLASAFMLGYETYSIEVENNIKKYAQKLKTMKNIMKEQQLFLYHMFCGCLVNEVGEESIYHLKKAALYRKNSHQQFHLGYRYYYAGKQSQAIECYRNAYGLASEEGNAAMMMEIALHLGNCYCMYQRDQELMHTYYHQCLKLAKAIGKLEIQAVVYYNIGSSYLSWGMLQQAKSYLERSVNYACDTDVLGYQKLALLYAEMKDNEKMEKAIKQAKAVLSKDMPPLFHDMQSFVELHCDETSRYQKEYIDVLERICFKQDHISYSFRNFHIPYLICAYKKQRRYKEALQLKECVENNFS